MIIVVERYNYSMCGICGFVSKNTISVEQLTAMNDTMIHRGPDDAGVEIYPASDGFYVGMAQRRLSIMDLSMQGHQPMHSANKRVTVVFNGEIYNFQELKEELKEYAFSSNCDTEVIIAAYLKWGEDCLNHLNGMFALAIYDREKEEVILARDRIGKKPLYYWLEPEQIVFASEMKPIMNHPKFKKELNRRIVPRYLYQQYIQAPDTIFEHVYKLEPGRMLRFHRGRAEKKTYWDIKEKYHEFAQHPVRSYEEAKQALKELLKESVRKRMIADVPLGAFLSGGYDSSLMTAIAQEISNKPVKTFTIGFNEKGYNEAGYAKDVANYLGTNHTEQYISEEDMLQLVDSIPVYFDEPMADSSQIPTMLVSKLAKEQVTVVLSGDGGDELFCGYNIYENVAQAQKLDFLGGMVNAACNITHIRNSSLYEKIPFRVRVVAENRNPNTKTQFGASGYLTAITDMMLPEQYASFKYETEKEYAVNDWQMRRMLLDMETYLPEDILCKVDRASMKYSLESRCPILDKEIIEYSFRIPQEFKYFKGDKKHILKDIAHDYIPGAMLDRPKTGFGVPIDKWLRGPLKEQVLSYAEVGFLKHQGIFKPDYVNRFIHDYVQSGDGGPATGKNYSKFVWSFFVLQQWYAAYWKG